MCRNSPKKRGELPILNLHIMKEPGRSCLVERVSRGAEKSLQNIAGHEQKPEWCGDIESVQLLVLRDEHNGSGMRFFSV